MLGVVAAEGSHDQVFHRPTPALRRQQTANPSESFRSRAALIVPARATG